MKQVEASRTWRVRTWIRAVAVAVLLGLLLAQWSTAHYVRTGEQSPSELWWGWLCIAAFLLGVWVLVFRPSVNVTADFVTLQGPVRSVTFRVDAVDRMRITEWGLVFDLSDGSRALTIVCQGTMSRGDPRWFDVAQVVLGRRPRKGATEVTR